MKSKKRKLLHQARLKEEQAMFHAFVELMMYGGTLPRKRITSYSAVREKFYSYKHKKSWQRDIKFNE